jgi:hypothetical protein
VTGARSNISLRVRSSTLFRNAKFCECRFLMLIFFAPRFTGLNSSLFDVFCKHSTQNTRACTSLQMAAAAVIESLHKLRVSYTLTRTADIVRTIMSKWVGVCDEDGAGQWRLAVLVLLLLLSRCCERRLAFVLVSEYTAVLWLLGTDMLPYISSQHDTQTGKRGKGTLIMIVTCFLLTRRIIYGLRILYLNLLDIHQAELHLLITVSIYRKHA